MSAMGQCPQCGAALPPGVLAGHCPACLVAKTLADEDAPSEEIQAGLRRVGDYDLLGEIGRGGMGVVYRARQIGLNRIVALKMILAGEFASPEAVRRFRNEAEAAARLRHPNIVAIHEVGECDGRHYFAMELVEGPGLGELVRDRPLPARRAAEYLKAVAEAVAHAHAQRVLHRDLKPSNILLDPLGHPRVTDFGLARQLDSGAELTVTGQAVGSPGYMSPEQAGGGGAAVGPASDVYSLGAVLYHLLTSRPPFQGDTIHAVLSQVQNTEPVPLRRLNPSVPPDLETLCLKCLEKDPARRYVGAQEVADELGRFLRDEPIRARPISPLGRMWRWCRRRPAVAGLSASVLLLLVVVAVGASVAAWRVGTARSAEAWQRRKAEDANADLRVANARLADTVRQLELRRAEDFFRANDPSSGTAHLAAILRRNPSNHIAASRLVSALVHRDWALPAAQPMRHLAPVETVRFSPDGRLVLTVSRERSARVWDAATGDIFAQVPHRDRVLAGNFSPDGSRFVTASADGTARVWSSTNGSALTPPLAHKGRVNWVEFSPDGRRILTASADKAPRLWDAATGALELELRGHSTEVFFARFSPDGRRIVTAGERGSMRIWDAQSGAVVHRLQNSAGKVTALDFSPDGRRVIWICEDGFGQLWDAESGRPVGGQMIHADYKPGLYHAAFSPDGRAVVTTGNDGVARWWNTETGHPLPEHVRHEGGVSFVAFNADGRMVATASMDITARLWDARTGHLLCQPLRELGRIAQVRFSPDGRRLVTGSYDWKAQVWDIQPRRSRGLAINRDRLVRTAVFSPDGARALTASLDKTVRLFDTRTAQPLGEPLLHEAPVQDAQFSPDGRRVATVSDDGTVNLFEIDTRRLLAGGRRHSNTVWIVRFSPDGKCFATASADGTARVWDAHSGEPVTPPLRHDDEVVLANFSADGRLVVTGSEDMSARVWDARTGRPVTDRLPHADHLKWAEFSPDGERVVTASTDNTACIWSVATGRAVAPLLRHTRIVDRAVFSPDGLRVVTGSLDLTARVWDAATGQALTEPLKHNSPVTRVQLSPDGRRILTGCWNSQLRIWDAETGLPVTEWLNGAGVITDLSFDATGRRVVVGARGARIWEIPDPPVPVPGWFPAFAETVAGIRLSTRGNVELAPRQELEEHRARLAGIDGGDFYERLARWFLAEPDQRAGSPFAGGAGAAVDRGAARP